MSISVNITIEVREVDTSDGQDWCSGCIFLREGCQKPQSMAMSKDKNISYCSEGFRADGRTINWVFSNNS